MEGPRTIGIFYAWWRGDPLRRLAPLAGLAVSVGDTAGDLAQTGALNAPEAVRLMRDGHRLYVARLNGEVVAHGWSATRQASIGELGVEMSLSSTERYLWGFETQPRSRGHGIYTRMLQTILDRETDAARFWIGHDTGNDASAKGIIRAGFRVVGEVYQRAEGELRYAPTGDGERARAASSLLGIPIADARDDRQRPSAMK
jgi:hypothetical protein